MMRDGGLPTLPLSALYRAPVALPKNIFIRCATVAFGALTFAAAAENPPAPRVALVIGNSRYETAVGPLRNPVNDAKTMAKTLRALGFTVIERHNVTRDELLTAMLVFRAKLRGAEVGLFYFSGHGLAVAGANYLLPVKSGSDAENIGDTSRRLLAETRLFNAEQAVAEMSSAGAGCNLLILDACRTTPVARDPRQRAAASGGGLVEMNPPAGSLVAFATDAGHAASDGAGVNGLYTEELTRHLLSPGLSIEQVFKRTRARVMERSGGAQIPAEYSRLVGEDIFLAGPAPAPPAEPPVPKAEAVPVPSLAEISKLAAAGDAPRCVEALRRYTRSHAPASRAALPLAALLERVKENLRAKNPAAPVAESALQTCDLILSAVPDCLPAADAQRPALTAKAHSRRGDALLLLSRADEALAAFSAAAALTPDDPYILYNQGCALLALDRQEEAKTNFTKAADVKFKQSGARKLALQALAAMK